MQSTTTIDQAKAPGGGRATVRRSLIWSAVENFSSILISFGSLILYSRMLTIAEFGLFSIVLAVMELLDSVVRMFFHDALVQRKDITPAHFDTAFTVTMGISIVCVAACVALAGPFEQLVQSPGAGAILAWMTLMLPCGAITATIVAQQRRELSFKSLALRTLMGRLTGTVAGLTLVALGVGVWGLVVQQVLMVAIGSLVLWIGADQRPRLRFGMAELRDLWSFSLFSLGALILNSAVKRVFVIMAGAFLGLRAAGILNLAMRTVDTLYSVAATGVSQVAMPMLASVQVDRARMARIYRLATALTCAVMYGLFFGLAALGPEVVRVMFGAQWAEAAVYISIMACLTLLQAPRLMMSPLLTAIGRPADPMIARIVEMTVMVVLLWVVHSSALPTAVAIWVARELVGFPVMVWLVRRATAMRIRDQLRGSVTPLIASGAMVGAIVLARWQFTAAWPAVYSLGVLCVVGAVAFVAALALVDRSLLNETLGLVRGKRPS